MQLCFVALLTRSWLCIRLQGLLKKHTTVLSLMQVGTNIKALKAFSYV